MSYLQPMDTRQYLYCLKPKPEYAEKAGVIKGVTVIGKLDIVWKTNLGERGRLQTSQLQRMVPPAPPAPWRLSRLSSPVFLHAGAGIRRHPAVPGGDPRHRRPGGALPHRLQDHQLQVGPRSSRRVRGSSGPETRLVPTLSLQREDHGPGAGDVQHRLHPLVRNVGAEAGQAGPRRVPPPAAHALLLRPGPAGTSPRFSTKETFFFFFPDVLRLFLPEHFGIKTQRHFSEEDVRVRRHRTSVCDLPVPKQRTLGVELPSLVF